MPEATPLMTPDDSPPQPDERARRGRHVWGTVWRILVVVMLPFCLYAPFELEARLAAEGEPPPPVRAGLEIGALVAMLLVTAFMAWRAKLRLTDLGLGAKRMLPGLVAGLLLGSLWLLACGAAPAALGWLRVGSWRPFDALTGIVLIGTAANVLMQELLFRGYPFAVTAQRHGPRAAFGVSVLLFVLLHLGPALEWPFALVSLTATGVLFAELRRRTGNLWLCIGVHFAWNALLGPVAGLSVSGHDLAAQGPRLVLDGPAWWTGGSFGLEASPFTAVVTLVAFAIARRWRGSRITAG